MGERSNRTGRSNLVVLKYGGRVLSQRAVRQRLLRELLTVQRRVPVLMVHGGGNEVTQLLTRLGLRTRFIHGLRYTDAPTLEAVEMVLSGKVNKAVVSELNALAGRSFPGAVGISGKDGKTLVGRRRGGLGAVGDPTHVTPRLLETLLAAGYLPVLASVGMDEGGGGLNINADSAATAVAAALKADRLVFMTDVSGVLNGSGKLIARIHLAEVPVLIRRRVVSGGMIPKLEAAVQAIRHGIRAVEITDGRHGLAHPGTTIHR